VRIGIFPAGQPDQGEQLLGRSVAAAAIRAANLERQADVLDDRAPGEQRGILEHEADVAVAARRLGRPAEHGDRAGRWRHQIGDHAQQCRLAATGGPEQREEAAVGHAQTDVVERVDGAAVGRETNRDAVAHHSRRRGLRRRPGMVQILGERHGTAECAP